MINPVKRWDRQVNIVLTAGAHESRDQGMCLMEAVAWLAGEPHTDRPACVCPALAAYGMTLNDCVPSDARQGLLEFIPDLIGTAGDGHAEIRRWLALDWACRVWLPTWLDQVPGCTATANRLRELPPIRDLAAAVEAIRTGYAAATMYVRSIYRYGLERDVFYEELTEALGGSGWSAAWAAWWSVYADRTYFDDVFLRPIERMQARVGSIVQAALLAAAPDWSKTDAVVERLRRAAFDLYHDLIKVPSVDGMPGGFGDQA